MNKISLITVILVLVGGVVGFFAGSKYQQGSRTAGSSQFQFRQRFGNNTKAVRGQILSTDSKSITIKFQDGSTKIVIIPSSATIYKTDSASVSDLKKDEAVVVFGMDNSDGSVTAENVQLNPRVGPGSPMPTR